MALSFSSVEKAYQVLDEIKTNFLPELIINSWPDDIFFSGKPPKENTVYGYSRKSDDGWESLVFWTSSPSDELKEWFESQSDRVPNSQICRYHDEVKMWQFGWF